MERKYNLRVALPIVELLNNGLSLIIEPQPWNPGLSFTLLVPVGAVNDPEEYLGAASMLETWLWKGAGPRDARDFADALDALGLRRQSGAGLEYTTFSASVLPEGFSASLELYADLMKRPHLPDAAFDAVRALALQELAGLQDQPARKLFNRLRREVFASPHGQPVEGTRETINRITPEVLRGEFQRRYGASGSVLAVAGGIDPHEVVRLAKMHLGDWGKKTPKPAAVSLSRPHRFHIEQSSEQVQIGLFYRDVPPGDYDFYTARLAATVLSGDMSSRLFTEVREKRGLVYSVSATPGSVKGFGYLRAYAGTMPEKAQETLAVLKDEIYRLREGVSRAELDRAKVGMRANLVLSGESSYARASTLARDMYLLGRVRSLEELEAEVIDVTLERMNNFLAGHPYSNPWIGTLGPKGAI